MREKNIFVRFYLGFETMRNLSTLTGDESILQVLEKITQSKEFSDVILRTGEKKILNSLNSGREARIRFKLEGKVKTPAMKVNVLIQVFKKKLINVECRNVDTCG